MFLCSCQLESFRSFRVLRTQPTISLSFCPRVNVTELYTNTGAILAFNRTAPAIPGRLCVCILVHESISWGQIMHTFVTPRKIPYSTWGINSFSYLIYFLSLACRTESDEAEQAERRTLPSSLSDIIDSVLQKLFSISPRKPIGSLDVYMFTSYLPGKSSAGPAQWWRLSARGNTMMNSLRVSHTSTVW